MPRVKHLSKARAALGLKKMAESRRLAAGKVVRLGAVLFICFGFLFY